MYKDSFLLQHGKILIQLSSIWLCNNSYGPLCTDYELDMYMQQSFIEFMVRKKFKFQQRVSKHIYSISRVSLLLCFFIMRRQKRVQLGSACKENKKEEKSKKCKDSYPLSLILTSSLFPSIFSSSPLHLFSFHYSPILYHIYRKKTLNVHTVRWQPPQSKEKGPQNVIYLADP